jgi:hypothetical protein
MASKYLDGSMVPRRVKRVWDQRLEPRSDAGSSTAVLGFRRREFEVRVVNLSSSGAMLIFSLIPCIGETISIRLNGRNPVPATVCWVRDGKIGINFAVPVE